MQDDTILCHQCGKELVMKFIELKDLVFCSTSCFERFRNSMSRHDFFKRYGEVFKPDEQHWVPKYANEYIKMCGYCPPRLAETCRAELDLSGVYHDDIAETETMHWCCHARFILGTSLSDGTVSRQTAERVQQRAEEITRQQGIHGVTTTNVCNAFVDLGRRYEYRKVRENPPEAKPLSMSHAAACLLCNPDFARECEEQVEKEFQHVGIAKARLKGHILWCAHTVQSLAEMIVGRAGAEELLDKIIAFTESVAREKGHPGVITRDLFIALGRMAAET